MLFCRIDELNQSLSRDPAAYIAAAEASYHSKVERVAQQVRACCAKRPIVLISGPSGSGKTTTANKLEEILDGWGIETHTISMDNYFYSWSDGEVPRDEEGNVDLESPLRLDVPLLQQHLGEISRCEPISIPRFDFERQQRCCESECVRLHRKPGELIILEGIHALNPAVTGSAAPFSTGIYVSVRTRLLGKEGALLHPEKLRLMRRLMRDNIYRGQNYDSTIARLRSVSRGEGLYILPHKEHASISVDTFLPYEPAVYASELLSGLEFSADALEAAQAAEVLDFLREIAPLPVDAVPANSLLREFVGEVGVPV